MELAGRTALLTGATGGLGRAIAEALAERGANLVAERAASRRRWRRWPPSCRATATGSSPPTSPSPAPPRRSPPRRARSTCSSPTPVCPAPGGWTDFSAEEVTRALRVNLEAPMLLARALYPAMLERGSGHLVFVASLSGKSASPTLFDLQRDQVRPARLRAGAARRPRPQGIGVSLVSPGLHPRSRHVRRVGRDAAAGARHLDPEAGRGAVGEGDRGGQGRGRGGAAAAAGARPPRHWSAPASRCGRQAAAAGRRRRPRSPPAIRRTRGRPRLWKDRR